MKGEIRYQMPGKYKDTGLERPEEMVFYLPLLGPTESIAFERRLRNNTEANIDMSGLASILRNDEMHKYMMFIYRFGVKPSSTGFFRVQNGFQVGLFDPDEEVSKPMFRETKLDMLFKYFPNRKKELFSVFWS